MQWAFTLFSYMSYMGDIDKPWEKIIIYTIWSFIWNRCGKKNICQTISSGQQWGSSGKKSKCSIRGAIRGIWYGFSYAILDIQDSGDHTDLSKESLLDVHNFQVFNFFTLFMSVFLYPTIRYTIFSLLNAVWWSIIDNIQFVWWISVSFENNTTFLYCYWYVKEQ